MTQVGAKSVALRSSARQAAIIWSSASDRLPGSKSGAKFLKRTVDPQEIRPDLPAFLSIEPAGTGHAVEGLTYIVQELTQTDVPVIAGRRLPGPAAPRAGPPPGRPARPAWGQSWGRPHTGPAAGRSG